MDKEELYRDALESIRAYCIERSHIIYCDNIGDIINQTLEKADRQPEDSADTYSDPSGCKLMKCTDLINERCYYNGECKYR